MGAAGGQAAPGPTGRPRAHTSARASARAGRCVGSPTCGSAAAGICSEPGGRREAAAEAAWRQVLAPQHQHRSAQQHVQVCPQPRPTPAAWASHTPAYEHIAQVRVTDLTLPPPHPSSARATCSTAPKRTRRRASYCHSLALNLCSGQHVSVVLSFPSQYQPHEMFVHWGHQ